ncbi:MAG: translation initiation factor IF-3 [Angelakisella sp.]
MLCNKFKPYRRCFAISNKELQINEEIRDKELRVIDADGAQLGILATKVALDRAIEKNLDLVKIAPQATPPVCRIMDYGKFRFEQAKRDKEAKKNQKVIDIKEVRLSLNIDTHDFDTKVGHAKRFLSDGDKVKVSIRFRGREMAHASLGGDIMRRFADACAELGAVEKLPKLEGRSMIMFLAVKTAK